MQMLLTLVFFFIWPFTLLKSILPAPLFNNFSRPPRTTESAPPTTPHPGHTLRHDAALPDQLRRLGQPLPPHLPKHLPLPRPLHPYLPLHTSPALGEAVLLQGQIEAVGARVGGAGCQERRDGEEREADEVVGAVCFYFVGWFD